LEDLTEENEETVHSRNMTLNAHPQIPLFTPRNISEGIPEIQSDGISNLSSGTSSRIFVISKIEEDVQKMPETEQLDVPKTEAIKTPAVKAVIEPSSVSDAEEHKTTDSDSFVSRL
uniref:ADDG protein n=1 Tax=Gongylonema pulchrum TaxID=637853 RepID=A0A183D6K4_9BILA